ncbi:MULTISPECIES: flap endonuclease-1 [Methanobacterium]|jgi:flap endonuclease-1|uniref:Flap endonuclease 1 n=1 Tax=Methanobacterium subterraneum TaxID=59277 RepID=A0A2H4VT49_9EURY|nr:MULTISPECIES: flap endonuclease-1 [Methanobacterium]MBW4256753.1 flap endonuclease-1 [Methanobacterium sp. YSL]AUB58113.1 flap endonuclease-1 [Methanobacterium sp. MZ-A1]AUB61256.1 flap endonuclease-1 [Methanobacterium subterraneum]MCC7559193.1 flap endonuclease-1 [Methanobacterium sp.]NMO09715.1 flap endonuclease-1 [Methanobacterium subterraneum]
MGVKFKDIVSPEEIRFEDLDGKIVALDAANVIYQFLSSIRQLDGTPLKDQNGRVTSHFSGILYRTSALVEKGIKPIYVFDGQSSALKKETQQKRKEIKEESERKWKEALEEGRLDDARKFAVRSSRMSPEIVEGSKKLIKLMGIPYIQAKGEGEAQASYMVARGDAWCVASQDYDCMLFGAPRMVKNLTISGSQTNPELIELDKVLGNLGVTREQLVDMAIMVGTDFNQGIKGIGAKKGLKLIKEHGDIYQILEKLDIELDVDPTILRNMFLNHEVDSDYELKWQKADQKQIVDFLCGEHDFSESRVLSALDKLKKLQTTQSSLEQWF